MNVSAAFLSSDINVLVTDTEMHIKTEAVQKLFY